MMSDLRAEIEQLRAQVAAGWPRLTQEIAERDAEIEWLREELHTERHTREQHERTIRELCDEMERLTAALEGRIEVATNLQIKCARLTAALETIRHGTVSGHIEYERVRDFIDRALDGEKG